MTTDTRSRGELRGAASAVLIANDRGKYVAPGPHQYPGQWNWDAALVSIGLAYLDPERARREIEHLLEGQWEDGLVPHIVFWNGEADYFPGPGTWQSRKMDGAPSMPVTGITQPPVAATALRVIHERHPDVGFLERVLPGIEKWHQWLNEFRLTEYGLVALYHPWESGTDNSPRFDEALARVPLHGVSSFERRDTIHVAPDQRPNTIDYRRYLALVESLRKHNYRPRSHNRTHFAIADVGFNSILAAAEDDLIALWSEIGADGNRARARLESLRRGVNGCWDKDRQAFLDIDILDSKPVADSAECSSSLLPLVAGFVNDRQAETLAAAIWDESRFGPSAGQPFGVTSVAKRHRRFEPLRYWRGPVWVNMNWFLIRGLQRCGLEDHAAQLREMTIDLVRHHGIYEYYDPRDGQGLGSPSFSWTAALVLDLMERP